MSLKRCGLGATENLLRKRELCVGYPHKMRWPVAVVRDLARQVENQKSNANARYLHDALAKFASLFPNVNDATMDDRSCIKLTFFLQHQGANRGDVRTRKIFCEVVVAKSDLSLLVPSTSKDLDENLLASTSAHCRIAKDGFRLRHHEWQLVTQPRGERS